MYSPVLGRFQSRDPLPLEGQPDLLYGESWVNRNIVARTNLYAYVENNTPNRVDPSGLAEFVARKPRIPKEVTSTLDCPGYGCQSGQCSFKLSFDARVFPDGSVAPGARICFEHSPGEYSPPGPLDPTICQSEINRSLGESDHMTVILLDGIACKFTESDFPNRPWPPRRGTVNPMCQDIFRYDENDPGHPPEGPHKGGCYITTDTVKSVAVNMTMAIACYCTPCKGFANYDSLKFEASTK